jgi:ABC-2 type transport system ATP-binding protein
VLQKAWRDFIKEHIVAEKGKTVFISTHQLDEAEQLCDRVAILDEGRIKVQGSPSELKESLSGGGSLCDVFSFYTGKAFVEQSASSAPFTLRRDKRRGRGLGMKRKGF